MKNSLVPVKNAAQGGAAGFPSLAQLTALRAWYAGLDARSAVVQYLGHTKADGQSSRAMLNAVRRQLAAYAHTRHREDLASLILHPARERLERARAVQHAIDKLRNLPLPTPLVTDAVDRWLPTRAARALQAFGIHTLADLTVRVPRRRRWWAVVPGLGATAARHIEAFFAAHPALTARARALVVVDTAQDVVPWELLQVPEDVDGSQGRFRAPAATCTLRARNDFEAVQAWLSLHEAPATQRAYRKEAERLILWAVLDRSKALSSLTTEDAIAVDST